MQVAAAKALSQFVSENETIRTLLAVAKDSGFETRVRVEAVKSLATEAQNSRTHRELIALYERESDLKLKAWILKSLYLAAPQSQVRNFLENVLKTERNDELLKAAAFAVMTTATTNSTTRILTIIINDNRFSDDVKVEALKSLFWLRKRDFYDFLENIALNKNVGTLVRVASVKLLQVAFHQSNERVNFLTGLAARETNLEVRLAALDALRPRFEERDVRWFHLARDPHSTYTRNPLED